MSSICPYCPLPLKEFAANRLRATCGTDSCVRQHLLLLWSRNHAKERERSGRTEVTCPICGLVMNAIGGRHLRSHGISTSEFRALYPGVELTANRTRVGRGKSSVARAAYSNATEVTYDEAFHAFMVGTLLGDGSLERQRGKSGALKTARYAEGGSNQAYLTWKHEFISKYMECSFQQKTAKPHVRSGKCYTAWWLRTKAYPILNELHGLWYPDGKKIVPMDYVMRHFSPLAFVVWACDDGHRDQSGLLLYTMAFSEVETKALAELIESHFDVAVNVRSDWKGRPHLYIRSSGIRKIDEMMKRFNIPGMAYKSIPKKGRIKKDPPT